MTQEVFDEILRKNAAAIREIQDMAHQIHAGVNQHYGKCFPYSVHIDCVAKITCEYARLICDTTEDILPIIFAAYFHDTIEDARLTYNNVMKIATSFMTESQAHMATEIVYALTNEKGRTRAERANDKYYEGIRTTPYAPLCKVADRLANVSFSAGNSAAADKRMLSVYAAENPHFLAAVTGSLPYKDDLRLLVPSAMIEHLTHLLHGA